MLDFLTSFSFLIHNLLILNLNAHILVELLVFPYDVI